MTIVRVGICTDADVFEHRKYAAVLSSLDVVLLPELMDGGYAAINNGKPPHTFNDSFILRMRTASRRFSFTAIAGSTILHHNTARPTNTSLVFHGGKLVHRYDKIHLFKPTGDTTFFQPGVLTPRTFSLQIRDDQAVRAGVIICYDLRFPELVRVLAARGMSILFVPARWPQARDEAWQSLLKARAIENQIFVVGCDAADNEGGYSYAFDPTGKLIFSNRKNKITPLHTFDIDLDLLSVARKLHRNLDDAVFLKSLL
jgi:omega-amidase